MDHSLIQFSLPSLYLQPVHTIRQLRGWKSFDSQAFCTALRTTKLFWVYSSPLMNRWTRSQSPSSSTSSPQPRLIFLTGCCLYARSRPDTVHWRCGSTKNATSHAAVLAVPSDVIEDPRIPVIGCCGLLNFDPFTGYKIGRAHV